MAKVLVVDDSPTELYQFKDILEGLGHEVVTASDGKEGVERSLSELPDLILMDVVMPDMNGFQATRKITRSEQTRHIPVIIISSKDQETDKVWGKRQGAKGYITKPVDHQELVSLINEFL